jgi:ferrochelatase
MKNGILLLNFGGPWTLKDVKPFLYRLFADPAVLHGVPAPLRQIIAFSIAQIKGRSSIKCYESIGGGSPQLKWTQIQAEGLRKLIPNDEVKIEIGMRNAEPSIESALSKLKTWGAERLILLPLFPQFSTTTTGTCFEEVKNSLSRLNWSPQMQKITRWADNKNYVALLRSMVDEEIRRAEEDRARDKSDDEIYVLFSAHSLPMKIVNAGDDYATDVESTIDAVTQNLNHPWSLSFQSRNGKMRWLEPYLEDELKRLGESGVRRLVVAHISFVSDHIETLYELDQLYFEQAKSHGIEHYYRVRAFNDDPEFPRVLNSVLSEVKL